MGPKGDFYMEPIAFDADLLKILLPILVIQLILIVAALVALVRAERTRGPKWLWALLILFGSLLGPIAFFLVGRRND